MRHNEHYIRMRYVREMSRRTSRIKRPNYMLSRLSELAIMYAILGFVWFVIMTTGPILLKLRLLVGG